MSEVNNKRLRDVDEDSSQSHRPKLLSSIVVVNSQQNGDLKPEEDDMTISSVQNSIKSRSDIEIQPENRNRNKRMFGSLIGHLGLARKNLEKDVIINKQNTVATSVLHKNSEESKRLSDLKHNALKNKLANEKKIELETLTKQWRNNLEQLKNFIFTETSPKICWLPAHHNETTNALLKRREEDINELILERERSDTQTINDLFGIKSHTNEKETDACNRTESTLSVDGSANDVEPRGEQSEGDRDEQLHSSRSNGKTNIESESRDSPNRDSEVVDGGERLDERPSEADLW